MNTEQCWQAVQNRDRSADGTFVYAVRSTGIYCRPSCPARRPKRERVVFFDAPDAAERNGYRACHRCHPRDLRAEQPEWIERACAYIEAHLDEPLTLDALSAQVNVSPYHLQRTFKRAMGLSPRQYAEAQRLAQFKNHLKRSRSVTAALYDAGYSSSSRLYERASAQLGMTPSVYRKGGCGMRIDYMIVDSPLGRLLVAATAKGICFVSLGDSDASLETALKEEYPAAEIARADQCLEPWVNVILNYLRGQQTTFDLPLDVQATAFQWRVWQTLRKIPYGATRTYSEIAVSLGNPKANRAVAHACATNPVSLVVPCHRVVRADGSLGGYRWGLERKQKLLEQERKTKT